MRHEPKFEDGPQFSIRPILVGGHERSTDIVVFFEGGIHSREFALQFFLACDQRLDLS